MPELPPTSKAWLRRFLVGAFLGSAASGSYIHHQDQRPVFFGEEQVSKDDILSHLSEEQVLVLFKNPSLLDGRFWQSDAIFNAACRFPEIALQHLNVLERYVSTAQILTVASIVARHNTPFFFQNYTTIQHIPGMREVLIDIALPQAKTDHAEVVVEYFNLYRDEPNAQDILNETLSRFSVAKTIQYAHFYRSAPNAEQILSAAILGAQERPEIIVMYADGYSNYPHAEQIFSNAAEKILNSPQSNIDVFFKYFQQYEQYASSRTFLEKAIEMAPKSAVFYKQGYEYSDVGKELFQKAFTLARKHDDWIRYPLDVIDHFDAYASEPDAEVEFALAFRRLDPTNVLSRVNAGMLTLKPWLPAIVQKAAESEPFMAMHTFENYRSLPNAEQILHAAVQKVMVSHTPAILPYDTLWQFDWGKKIIEDREFTHPRDIVSHLYILQDAQAVTKASEILQQWLIHDPSAAFQFLSSIDIAWTGADNFFVRNLQIASPKIEAALFLRECAKIQSIDFLHNSDILSLIKNRASEIPVDQRFEFLPLLQNVETAWLGEYYAEAIAHADDAIIQKNSRLLMTLSEDVNLQRRLLTAYQSAEPKVVLHDLSNAFALHSPDIKRYVIEACEKLSINDVVSSLNFLNKLDSDWTKTYVNQRVKFVSLHVFFASIQELYRYAPEATITRLHAEMQNDQLVIEYANIYRGILSEEERKVKIIDAAHRLLMTRPEILIQYYEQYSDISEAGVILKQAIEKADNSFLTLILKDGGLLKSLSIQDGGDAIIERAIINDPVYVSGALDDDNEAAYILRRIVSVSELPEIKNLRTILHEPIRNFTTRKHLIIAAVTQPQADMQTLRLLIQDERRFLQSLLSVKYNSEKHTSTSVDETLRYFALKVNANINALHDANPAVRFRDVADDTTLELYTLIVFGSNELYTSSYNGLFDRLLNRMESEDVDSVMELFELVQYQKFRVFIQLALQFGRFDELMEQLNSDQKIRIMQRLVEGMNTEKADMLNESVIIADSFSRMTDPEMLTVVSTVLEQKYSATIDLKAKMMYGLLGSVLAQVVDVDSEWMKQMQQTHPLPQVERLDHEALFLDNKNVQRYFFYDDEDGIASFNNFMQYYTNDAHWHIDSFSTYIRIRSIHGEHIEIFANRPTHPYDGGVAIQDIFETEGLKPQVIVHRGHSYYAEQTIQQIPQSAQLVSLGSCGGYSLLYAVQSRAPETQLIATQGTGSQSVNDPLLKMLNEEIRLGNTIVWDDVWKKAEKSLGNNPKFSAYVPPHRNLSALFARAYTDALSKIQKE